MMTDSDLKSYLRDLVYLEEDVIALLRTTPLPTKTKDRIFANLTYKQVVITKLINFISPPQV